MQFPTHQDIAVAEQTRARDAALRAYMGKSNSYDPRELPAHVNPPSNELRSHAERVAFFTQPLAHGQSYTAYLAKSEPHAMPLCNGHHVTHRITTWTGETLAHVTRITSRRERRGFTTDTRGSFWARGIDGRVYYGTHNGAGMYCRMRLSKRGAP